MYLPRSHAHRRRGLSLLEVLVALAIFLLSYASIHRLVTFAAERALEVKMMSECARLCQSKMAEVQSGAVPLSGADDSSFEAPEDSKYSWSVSSEQASTSTNLYNVTVTVTRQRQDGTQIEATLSQMMLDPTLVGSTQDTITITGTAPTSGGSGGNSSSGSTGSMAGGSMGGSMGGSKGSSTSKGSGSMGSSKGSGGSGGNTSKPSGSTGGATGGGSQGTPKNSTPAPSPSPAPKSTPAAGGAGKG